jgi:hypothetical protein
MKFYEKIQIIRQPDNGDTGRTRHTPEADIISGMASLCNLPGKKTLITSTITIGMLVWRL